MEVSNTNIETAGSNNYRDILEDNKDTNNILAVA